MALCFAKTMGEFGATITFVSNIPGETQTIPTAIYTFTQVAGAKAAPCADRHFARVFSMGALVVPEILSRRMRTFSGLAAKGGGASRRG